MVVRFLQSSNQMEHGSTIDQRPNEISIPELLADTWKAKWTVLAIVTIFTIAGMGLGLLIGKKYRADILLSPVAESPTGSVGGLGAITSQFGELASMAGLSLSGRGANNKDESVAVLQSQL